MFTVFFREGGIFSLSRLPGKLWSCPRITLRSFSVESISLVRAKISPSKILFWKRAAQINIVNYIKILHLMQQILLPFHHFLKLLPLSLFSSFFRWTFRHFLFAHASKRSRFFTNRLLGLSWRRHPDSNRRITVLQTAALATWLCRLKSNGAGERIWTVDVYLGKVALYHWVTPAR